MAPEKGRAKTFLEPPFPVYKNAPDPWHRSGRCVTDGGFRGGSTETEPGATNSSSAVQSAGNDKMATKSMNDATNCFWLALRVRPPALATAFSSKAISSSHCSLRHAMKPQPRGTGCVHCARPACGRRPYSESSQLPFAVT
jgi:hypothetical protein